MTTELQAASREGCAQTGLARPAGSACLVCGSTLTLPIIRNKGGIDFPLVHCNHCGSEIPQRTIREIDRYRATAHDHETVRLDAALREAVRALEMALPYVPCSYNSGCNVRVAISAAINRARDPQNTIVSQPGGKPSPAVTPPDGAAR